MKLRSCPDFRTAGFIRMAETPMLMAGFRDFVRTDPSSSGAGDQFVWQRNSTAVTRDREHRIRDNQ